MIHFIKKILLLLLILTSIDIIPSHNDPKCIDYGKYDIWLELKDAIIDGNLHRVQQCVPAQIKPTEKFSAGYENQQEFYETALDVAIESEKQDIINYLTNLLYKPKTIQQKPVTHSAAAPKKLEQPVVKQKMDAYAQSCAPHKSTATACAPVVASGDSSSKTDREYISGALTLDIPKNIRNPLNTLAQAWYTIHTDFWSQSGGTQKDWFKSKSTLIDPAEYHITFVSFKVPTKNMTVKQKEMLEKHIKTTLEKIKPQELSPQEGSMDLRFSFKKFTILNGQGENPPHYFVVELKEDSITSILTSGFIKHFQEEIKKHIPAAEFPSYPFRPHISLVSMSPAIKQATHVALPDALIEALQGKQGTLNKRFYTEIRKLQKQDKDNKIKNLTLPQLSMTLTYKDFKSSVKVPKNN